MTILKVLPANESYMLYACGNLAAGCPDHCFLCLNVLTLCLICPQRVIKPEWSDWEFYGEMSSEEIPQMWFASGLIHMYLM